MKVKLNLANPFELQDLPGIGPEQADAIIRFRAEHGPILDAGQLRAVLKGWPIADAVWEQVEFDPSITTSPEAPGA